MHPLQPLSLVSLRYAGKLRIIPCIRVLAADSLLYLCFTPAVHALQEPPLTPSVNCVPLIRDHFDMDFVSFLESQILQGGYSVESWLLWYGYLPKQSVAV